MGSLTFNVTDVATFTLAALVIGVIATWAVLRREEGDPK